MEFQIVLTLPYFVFSQIMNVKFQSSHLNIKKLLAVKVILLIGWKKSQRKPIKNHNNNCNYEKFHYYIVYAGVFLKKVATIFYVQTFFTWFTWKNIFSWSGKLHTMLSCAIRTNLIHLCILFYRVVQKLYESGGDWWCKLFCNQFFFRLLICG